VVVEREVFILDETKRRGDMAEAPYRDVSAEMFPVAFQCDGSRGCWDTMP
jgi:hypothetical protein